MPILSGDIQLLASERLSDTSDGGGRMTGRVIVDGQSNNLFPDVSELDRTYGRVNLRKCFLSVLTDSTDSYFGAHIIVAVAPEDPRVAITLFTTKSWTDRRDGAKDRIERYLARGVRWPGQLLERQLTGQRAIALLLKAGDAVPRIGQTLVLVQDEAKPTEIEQYVRITRIATVEREFRVDGQTFRATVATCEIADALRYDFEGPPPQFRDDGVQRAVCRDTVIANAAVYFGVQPTVAPATIGDLKIQVASLFGQLVPSAQAEIPLVDLNAAGSTQPLIDAGNSVVSFQTSVRLGPGFPLFVGSGIVPGSLRIVVSGGELIDDAGQLKSASTVIGTVDYGRGIVTFALDTPQYSGWKTIYFRPAAAPIRVADTAAIAVPQEGRGYTYTLNLDPAPQPGSLSVAYMAQGKWYELRDRGDGSLRGSDTAFGAGSIDFATGSVTITTGALADANTEVLFAWGTASNYFNRVSSAVRAPQIQHICAHAGLVPGSLTLSWTDGANLKSATDDGKGKIIGDALGHIRYAQGELVFTPTVLPAGGAEIALSYQHGPPLAEEFPHPLRNGDGTVTINLAQGGIRPNSVELEFNLIIDDYDPISTTPAEMQIIPGIDPIKIARDVPNAANTSGVFGQEVSGTIDYASGSLTFRPDITIAKPFPRYRVVRLGFTRQGTEMVPVFRNTFSHFEYVPAAAYLPLDESGWVKVRYRASDSPNVANETIVPTELSLDLTDRFAERIVPGSVRFTLSGKTYVDRLGSLLTDLDINTGAAIQAGTVDYGSGRCVIKVFQPAANNTVQLQALLTELTGQPVDELCFRVPAAPVRPGSLQIRAAPLTGGSITAVANTTGVINTNAMQGSVDYQTGIVRVRFGRWVQAQGNETQIWYSPEAIVNGRIFKPLPVLADTLRFNAVAYTYLPLSADVLGLDPVRLPPDGKVPIFRPGDVAVVHHTERMLFPNPVTSALLNVGRVRLSSLKVLDAEGKALAPEKYTADLDLGTVQLTAPINLTGYVQPLVAEHRIEDMALISDTQINGMLALTRPLTHAYPQGETKVSSALIVGDLQTRAHTLFAQQTWTGEWKDSRIGANTIAQYNATVFPLEVSNRGAIEERWALIFTGTTEYRVIGESVGQIAVGNTTNDLAPMNPETHAPYFRLRAAGFGAGWSAGNVLRFNTAGANYPIWMARTILQGPATADRDAFQVQMRGDVDR
jgi:hypothetical protein